jgi:nuclear transport factor 2 (NTF2) superfamily protein
MTDSLQASLASPFTWETAVLKVRKAEDGWNSRNPQQVALAYSVDSHWRNRAEFLAGREEIIAFLTRKWENELEDRLIKELWVFHKTELRCALPTSHTTHQGNGGGPTAMRIGNSTRQG